MENEKIDKIQNLENYFVKRIARFLKSKGKRIIGWDEILEPDADLPEGSIVQSWRGFNGAFVAATHGFDTIVSPVGFCYLDHLEVG